MADSSKAQVRRDTAEKKSEPGVKVIECDEEVSFRLHCCCIPCFEKVVEHKTLFFRPGNTLRSGLAQTAVELLEKKKFS